MTLGELQMGIKADLRIDPSDLIMESVVRTPEIHWTYSKMLMTEELALKKLNREYKTLYLQTWEYYRKKADPEVYVDRPLLKKVMDVDAKNYIVADPDILELQAKIDAKEELVSYLKRTVDQINQRQWLIKNAQDHLNYLAGGKTTR